jgi:hypothetical protein
LLLALLALHALDKLELDSALLMLLPNGLMEAAEDRRLVTPFPTLIGEFTLFVSAAAVAGIFRKVKI